LGDRLKREVTVMWREILKGRDFSAMPNNSAEPAPQALARNARDPDQRPKTATRFTLPTSELHPELTGVLEAVGHRETSMDMDGPDRVTSETGRGRPDGRFLGLLRAVALIALVAWAGGSVGLMLRAGQRTPRLLLVLFTIWVLSPFVALLWANMVSNHWSVVTRATLYCVTLILTLGSLAIYGGLVLPPAGSARAFVFVAVPPP